VALNDLGTRRGTVWSLRGPAFKRSAQPLMTTTASRTGRSATTVIGALLQRSRWI
jgi:hypothetical protein